jgi:hypothetical protein
LQSGPAEPGADIIAGSLFPRATGSPAFQLVVSQIADMRFQVGKRDLVGFFLFLSGNSQKSRSQDKCKQNNTEDHKCGLTE